MGMGILSDLEEEEEEEEVRAGRKGGAHRDVQGHPLHVHLLDDEDKGLVPVRVKVATLHAGLLLLSNSFVLSVEQLQFNVRVGGTSDVHFLQLPGLQYSN